MNKVYSANVCYYDENGNVDKKKEVIKAVYSLFYVNEIREIRIRNGKEYIIAYKSKGNIDVTNFIVAFISTRSKKTLEIIFMDYMSYIKETKGQNVLNFKEISYLHHMFPEEYLVQDVNGLIVTSKGLHEVNSRNILMQPDSVVAMEKSIEKQKRLEKINRNKENQQSKNFIIRLENGIRIQTSTCQYRSDLVEVYKFPDGIEDVTDCFKGCINLKKCCAIPKSVKYYKDMFKGATNFRGTVKCSSNIKNIMELGLVNRCRVERDLDIMEDTDEAQELLE